MFLLEELSKAFNCTFTLQSSEENFESASFHFLSYDLSIPTTEELSNIFSKINSKDKIELQLNLSEVNAIIFQNSINTISELINQLKDKQQFYNSGEKVELKLILIKKNQTVSIYSIKAFITFLKALTIEQLLINFSNKLLEHSNLVFNCFDLKDSFKTETIVFKNSNSIKNSDNNIRREEVLDKIASNCSLTISKPLIIIPEDLFVIEGLSSNMELGEIFGKMLSTVILTVLFDITSLRNNLISYRLNGYKSIGDNFEITKPIDSVREYYQIYKWVYYGGNLSDKIGLARNIISLHINAKNSLEISGNTYLSIISSHKVYEKQNIKQYIDLRNKISDQIINFNEKANSIIENFASGFQKSALAFITLFSTIVITKVLTSKNFNNIFTFDATIISFLFLAGSLIYFFVLLWEVNAQLQRFKNSYLSMKKRNEDLLTKSDIDRILNDDEEHNNDLQFIKRKRKNYSILWLSFLLLFLATTMFLHWKYSQANPKEYSIYHTINSKS